jgi:hypothetical protein
MSKISCSKLNLCVPMVAYRTTANTSTLHTNYFAGLVNYGCPEVFAWCPSRVPFQFNFFTFTAVFTAGVLTVNPNSGITDIYVIRKDAFTLPFMCESK